MISYLCVNKLRDWREDINTLVRISMMDAIIVGVYIQFFINLNSTFN